MKVIAKGSHWMIKCQACDHHYIPKDRWKFDGNVESPSFTPSVNESVNQPEMDGYRPEVKSSRWHFTVTKGKITYGDDCSHDLRGQTLILPDFSAAEIACNSPVG